MKSLKQLLIEYKSEHKALPAFNVDSFEIYQAVENAVLQTKTPCIVQLSESEDKFIQAERLLVLVKKAQAESLPIYSNMDHGKDLNRLKQLAKSGFDMLHFDGSNLDYSANLTTSKQFVQEIKTNNPNTIVEVEFNQIDNKNFTDPSQALEFITQTDADLLAVSIGNLHGVNPDSPEQLDLSRLKEISQLLPQEKFLTLHGGSGISHDQISSAINLGIVKININTDLRLKFKESLVRNLSQTKSEKIYEYLTSVIFDLEQLIVQKLNQFLLTL